jgi:alcohol dehydrogenase class IV
MKKKYETPEDKEFRKTLMQALTSAGIGFAAFAAGGVLLSEILLILEALK